MTNLSKFFATFLLGLSLATGAAAQLVGTSIDNSPSTLPPSGAAGGVLSGTYPNPGFAANPSFTGTVAISGATTTGPDTEVSITGDTFARVAMGINLTDIPRISFGPGNAARDVFLERAGSANLRFGAPDAAAPVAQTSSVQNVVTGTSNTAGANRTVAGSQSTGNVDGGSILFQTSPAGGSGSTQNALATVLTLAGSGASTFSGSVSATTLALSGSSLTPLTATSTDAGAAVGPVAEMYRNSASPAVSDLIGAYSFTGNSSTAVKRTYANIQTIIASPTNAAEYANIQFQAMNNGTLTTGMTLDFGTTNRIVLGTGINGIGGNASQLTMGYNNTGAQAQFTSTGLNFIGSLPVGWGAGTFGTMDAMLTRQGAANIQFGAADAAAPVAQTLSFQSVVAGTSNTAGANATIKASASTGNVAGGSLIFQTTPLGGSGTSQNAYVNTLAVIPGTTGGVRVTGSSSIGFSGTSDATGTFNVGFYNVSNQAVSVDTVSGSGNALGSILATKFIGGTGGATSPMWKRNATAWNARLADDSADAPITAGTGSFSGNVTVGTAGGSVLFTNGSRIDDNGGSGLIRLLNNGAAAGIVINVGGNSAVFRTSNNGADAPITAASLQLSSAGKVYFGGVSSSFPALVNSSATLQLGLADASGWARLQSGQIEIRTDNALTAGGNANMYVGFSTSGIAIYAGSGAPTITAARGSIYMRSDGLPYYNTNGSTGWDQLAGLASANTFTAATTFSNATINMTALGNAATTSAVCYNTGTGLLTYNSTVGTCTVSTINAKDLLGELTPREGFDMVMAMEPQRYDLKKGLATYTPGEQIGFVAERAYAKDPRLVAVNPDGTVAGFRYEQYTAALTAAFKYLKADNDNMRAEIEVLKRAAAR